MALGGTGAATSRAQAGAGAGAEARHSEGPKGPAPPSWDGTPRSWRKFPLPMGYSAGARVAF
eukprot:5139450-Amphidinium_carterae.1